MNDFRILAPQTRRLGTYREETIDLHLQGSTPVVTLHRERGVFNPIGVVVPELMPSAVPVHQSSFTIPATPAVTDAVRALTELEATTGITGASLGSKTGEALFRYGTEDAYAGGGKYAKMHTPAQRAQVEQAARTLVDAARAAI